MRSLLLALQLATASALSVAAGVDLMPAPPPTYIDQGTQWTPAYRADFYTRDQGSEIMPLAWARALLGPDGSPFMGDRLARYGYLANDTAELPVGFTAANRGGVVRLGMTCAACHTREIEVDGASYRIDGAPALSDFQHFLHDLDGAVGMVLADDAAFRGFADRAIGPGAAVADRAQLRRDVSAWYHRQHTLFARALPVDPWGVGRLDAVSMILNRVAGLDIGTASDGIIAGNINPADAPVRYPFIWNAPRQDHTQWPGFADNGDVVLATARNLGEVYGVFADFHPIPYHSLLGYDFHSENSANFAGLDRLEQLVRRIGPPTWPWPTQPDRVVRGGVVFARACASCHAEQPGSVRPLPLSQTWKTPLVDAGTDTREYRVLARVGDAGVLTNARYGLGKRLGAQDRQFNILAAAVIGSMADRFLRHGLPLDSLIQPVHLGAPKPTVPIAKQELDTAYHTDDAERATLAGTHVYEARVLHGVWAAAPYLHNGSVASLAELLKRPEDRMPAFAVGPAYDRNTVGLSAVQPGAPSLRRTTGCNDLDSGNSRCGHRYGTDLSPAEKQDLIEFLKTF